MLKLGVWLITMYLRIHNHHCVEVVVRDNGRIIRKRNLNEEAKMNRTINRCKELLGTK